MSFIRNIFCECLALGILASGKVRRAKAIALRPGVVTPIYFHNPNRRLFARCIQWLLDHGYTFISTADLVGFLHHGKPLPAGAVWISFDDGYREWLDTVVPLVRQRRVPVTMFIPSGIVENNGLLPWVRNENSGTHNGRDTVTVSELKTIATYPEVTIGGHTVNHAVTENLPEPQKRFELGDSKRALETWTGSTVSSFAYPVGLYDGDEKPLLRELGYQLAATTDRAFITSQTDPYFVPRFCVSDNISFPEAICNMVGAWRPALDPLKRCFQAKHRARHSPSYLWKPKSVAPMRSRWVSFRKRCGITRDVSAAMIHL